MKTNQKVLTVSIAAYNVEDTIKRALDSLLDPAVVNDIEIIVVDDGGKDNTLKIAGEYADKYPDTVIPAHKENGGYGSTINYSIQKARGKYFKQLDGDDWFIPGNFVEFVELLRTIDTDCVITEVADYRSLTGEQVVSEKYTAIEAGYHEFWKTHFDSVLTMHGTAIRTDILRDNEIRIIENCFYSDTELVVLPMPFMNNFYMWKKALYVYVTGSEGQSMSISGIQKHYADHEKVFWELVEAYKNIPGEETYKRELVFHRIKKEAIIHFKFLLRLDICKKHYQELKTFGNGIKAEFPEMYRRLRKERRMFRVMWSTNYCAYPLISIKVKKEYN